ncbi:MAG TPA: SRPBCC family protein [Solirubrobacteraceae bacterium]|nr:SRPBCC family protein [Solirubrobacteraceae bacterium]
MPIARRSRMIKASPIEIWELVADPEHMPRWWPGVARMEGVMGDRFTQVFTTKRGRPVRADFRVIQSDRPYARAWQQEVEGTPFERVLNESIIAVSLAPGPDGTDVTIEQQQKLRGYSRTGGFLLRRATGGKLEEALDGLERILG